MELKMSVVKSISVSCPGVKVSSFRDGKVSRRPCGAS